VLNAQKHSKTMKHLTLITWFLLSVTFTAFGQEKHQIDIEHEHCHSLDTNWSTYGMVQCEIKASDKWDEEMNKYYKIVQELLTETQQENLKAAQREWIKFRDKELTFSSGLYSDMQGTMWHIASASTARELNRSRALELRSYYSNLTAGN
jgi:uncharacterized protein YecT (DUF1311 family)